MERRGENSPNYPNHGYDESKEITSKSGFTISWLNCSLHLIDPFKPGIYIKFCRPDGQIKETSFFEFGDEDSAQKKINFHVETLKRWREID